MKLQDQVVSLELSKKLKELGFEQESTVLDRIAPELDPDHNCDMNGCSSIEHFNKPVVCKCHCHKYEWSTRTYESCEHCIATRSKESGKK